MVSPSPCDRCAGRMVPYRVRDWWCLRCAVCEHVVAIAQLPPIGELVELQNASSSR